MIKAVVFDMDGVLIDSEPINIEAAVKSFQEEGARLNDSEKNYLIGRHPVDYIPYIGKKHRISLAAQNRIAQQQSLNYYALWDQSVTLIPGAKEIINNLRSLNMIITLATASSKKTVDRFLDKFKLNNMFSLIITKEDVTKRKPDPQIYNIAKKKLLLKENEILVIEDTQIGVESAKKAGLVCAAIPNKYTENQDFSKADYVLTSLNQILSIVTK